VEHNSLSQFKDDSNNCYGPSSYATLKVDYLRVQNKFVTVSPLSYYWHNIIYERVGCDRVEKDAQRVISTLFLDLSVYRQATWN
jgi:hypothetical protein